MVNESSNPSKQEEQADNKCSPTMRKNKNAWTWYVVGSFALSIVLLIRLRFITSIDL